MTNALARKDQPQAIPVSDVEDAAALTARVARDTHAREMTMARVDPFILVRIENQHRHEDLLLHIDTASPSSEEVPCLAVST